MRHHLSILLYSLFIICAYGCANHASHGHDHDHEEAAEHAAHDHDHEGHDHDHEGHGHDHEADSHEGHDHNHEADSHDTHTAHANHEGDETELTPTQQKRMGIAATPIQPKPFRGVIQVGGTLLSSPTDAATLVAPAAGQVTLAKNIVEGAQVQSGAPLFSINTEALAETNAATRTRLALEATTRRLERARQLAADKLITQKELDDTQAEYDLAKADYDAATRRGAHSVSVTSPMSGFITSALVRTGDYVEAGQTLATVSRARSMLLRAELPERYFARRNDIVSARFKPSYNTRVYDIDSLRGCLMARETAAQQNGGFLTITFAFDNADALVPGCYTEVWLLTRQQHDALCVPNEAIVREGDIFYVFLQEDPTCFIKREVTIGDTNGAETEILRGIAAGDKVVTSGAPQLAIAASARVIPAHSHNH